MKTHTKTLLTALATCTVAAGTANADFVWTGGAGIGSNWYDASNWDGGAVPNASDSDLPTNSTYSVGSENQADIVIWDSETAVGGYITPASLTNSNDWFGTGWHLSPATHLKNGNLTIGGTGTEYWLSGAAAIDLEVGDGDLGTSAALNLDFQQPNRHLAVGANGVVFKVNADGTINQLQKLNYNGSKPTTVQLNGGKYIVDGSVNNLSSSATNLISFDAVGAEFTADFGDDFTNLADVTSQFGDSFVDTTGGGLVATDNLDGSFTVSIVPEPSSLALLGLGGLLVARRRRG